jgi:hypothetical protein
VQIVPRHKPDLGKSQTIGVAKDSPRPEGQNPIARKKKADKCGASMAAMSCAQLRTAIMCCSSHVRINEALINLRKAGFHCSPAAL